MTKLGHSANLCVVSALGCGERRGFLKGFAAGAKSWSCLSFGFEASIAVAVTATLSGLQPHSSMAID